MERLEIRISGQNKFPVGNCFLETAKKFIENILPIRLVSAPLQGNSATGSSGLTDFNFGKKFSLVIRK